MPFQIFTIPVTEPDVPLQKLNQFLASHQVVEIDRHFCPNEGRPLWTFCINYVHGNPSTPSGSRNSKTDYKQVLSEEDFIVFARLRELRKQVAEEHAIPVFAVFTNEQLAQMATRRTTSLSALREIPGIGDKKVGSYGSRFVKLVEDSLHRPSPAESSSNRSVEKETNDGLFPEES